MHLYICNIGGAILGDPKGQHMVISGFSQRDVRAAEALSCDADKLALNLLDIFFTKDVLSTSLVTKWDGREMLDQDTIEGIRCKCFLISIACTFRHQCTLICQSVSVRVCVQMVTGSHLTKAKF